MNLNLGSLFPSSSRGDGVSGGFKFAILGIAGLLASSYLGSPEGVQESIFGITLAAIGARGAADLGAGIGGKKR